MQHTAVSQTNSEASVGPLARIHAVHRAVTAPRNGHGELAQCEAVRRVLCSGDFELRSQKTWLPGQRPDAANGAIETTVVERSAKPVNLFASCQVMCSDVVIESDLEHRQRIIDAFM